MRLDEEQVQREEKELHGLLRAVDDPPPSISAEAVVLRARAESAAARARGASRLRRAAAILVVVGLAGAAYAVPGSPVRGWVHSVVQRIGARPERSHVAPAPESTGGASGIAVLPGERLVILITSAQTGGSASVSLTDNPEVQVLAPVGAATFTSSTEQLLIDNQGSPATLVIQIPRSAPWVEIRFRGERVFLKDRSLVTTSGSTSAVGGYFIPLGPPGP